MVFGRLKNIFGSSKKDEQDINLNHSVRDLQQGWILDYDLRSWEVTDVAQWNWENAGQDKEFTITDGVDTFYLGLSRVQERPYGLFWEADYLSIPTSFRQRIGTRNQPPEEFAWQGKTYRFRDAGKARVSSLTEDSFTVVNYLYETADRTHALSINNYGAMSYEAYAGKYLERFEIGNILPRG